jgi:hypothetical protein
LPEPGYFRFYGSTIVELGRRGWDVALAFDRPYRRGRGVLVPAGAGSNVRSLGALPGRAASGATTLRIALDCLRYLEPVFAHATFLRRRAEKKLPNGLGFLTRIAGVPRWLVTAALSLGRLVERLIPVNRVMLDFVRELRPDVILVSPVVTIGRSGARQTELTKAGRALGIPVVAGTASWDNLTSKGLIRVVPDAVTVWNDIQAHEAEFLHRIPRSRILVTGAQSLDHWFEPVAAGMVDSFRRTLGIDGGRRVILLVGSSRNMAPGDSEVQFVRRWLPALRTSASVELRASFVIVRPHPGNTEQWQNVDLGDPHALVHPTSYTGMPLSDAEVDTFRYSLLASSAVVGINTTAMIEAAILRRPVLTVRDPAFDRSQQQTLHFAYLSNANGPVVTASSLAEHVAQLGAVLADSGSAIDAGDRFVRRFVRPLGIDTPATGHLCDAIERTATGAGQEAGVKDQVARSRSVAFSSPRRH